MEAATTSTRANEHDNQKYLPTLGDGVTLRGNSRKRGVVRQILPDGRAAVGWFDRDDQVATYSAVARDALEFCPTPEQIEAAASAIRRGWSPSERAKRNCYRQPARIKQYATQTDFVTGPANKPNNNRTVRQSFFTLKDHHYK